MHRGAAQYSSNSHADCRWGTCGSCWSRRSCRCSPLILRGAGLGSTLCDSCCETTLFYLTSSSLVRIHSSSYVRWHAHKLTYVETSFRLKRLLLPKAPINKGWVRPAKLQRGHTSNQQGQPTEEPAQRGLYRSLATSPLSPASTPGPRVADKRQQQESREEDQGGLVNRPTSSTGGPPRCSFLTDEPTNRGRKASRQHQESREEDQAVLVNLPTSPTGGPPHCSYFKDEPTTSAPLSHVPVDSATIGTKITP